MKKYTKIKVIRISETQLKTLQKMNEQLKKELLEYLIKLVTEKRVSKFLTRKAESLIKQLEE